MKYFSEKTKKMYDSVKDLEAAELDFDEKAAAEQKKREAKAARAKEIDEAYKAAQEAIKKHNDLVNAFIKDYGVYHRSESNMIPTPKNLFDIFINWPF